MFESQRYKFSDRVLALLIVKRLRVLTEIQHMQHLAELGKDEIGSLSLKGLDLKRFDKLLNSIKVDQVETNITEYLLLQRRLECSHSAPQVPPASSGDAAGAGRTGGFGDSARADIQVAPPCDRWRNPQCSMSSRQRADAVAVSVVCD